MDWQLLALSIVRGGSAFCAGILAVYAYRAYRATGRRGLLRLSLASALFTVGYVAAGVLYQATGDLVLATVLEAPFTLGALALILLSILGREVAGQRRAAATRVEG